MRIGGFGALVLDLERVAAAARGRRVRVVDLEPGLLDAVDEVDRRAREIRSAELVDDDLHAVLLELEVTLLDAPVEAEPVLEAGAPAALDRDAQHLGLARRLLGHKLLDLARRARGEG